MEKKNNRKRNLTILITIILIIALISTIIIRNVIIKNELDRNEYFATENTNSNLLASYIKKGVRIGGIVGTMEALDTSDATATPEDILEGKTAYVNGVKITGTYKEKIDEVEGVKIPNGFYYVGGTKNDGIVISDNEADENKYSAQNYSDQVNIPADGLIGNQFVWVPVEDIVEFKRYAGYYRGSPQSITDFYEPVQGGYGYSSEIEDYNNMMQSVENNHGFYVARFEAGIEDGKVVSKKGATVWNSIAWGNNMTDIGTNGAVAKSKGMYDNKETYNVTSTLIYSVQWDAIMTWIDPHYKTSSCSENSYVRNSTGKGNYNEAENTNEWKGKIAPCGASDSYRVKNIYDLAGNVREWTLEASTVQYRVIRGGYYLATGSDNTASHRDYIAPPNGSYYTGFRTALLM